MPVNPIITGFAPDPSIIYHSGKYYLVNSSFHLFPGLPIYSATSILGPWTHISNALSTRSQLAKMPLTYSSTTIWPANPEGEHMLGTGGLYAPTLRFHDGVFYIVCTNVLHPDGQDKDDLQNFILSTTDIEGEWSDPVYFEFSGIDPSLFWDYDGKIYVHGSAGPGPETKIQQYQIDLKTGEKLSEQKTIWAGVIKFWPEGPHIYAKDGWYYLMIAEGGTHEGHMIEMARSKSIWGPFAVREEGPILPPAGKREKVQYTGHGDLVQDGEGRWWSVCLGVRKMQDSNGKRYIMGRETFVTTVQWDEGEWPAIATVKKNLEGTGRENLVTERDWKIDAKGTLDLLYLRDLVFENFEILEEGRVVKIKADVGDLDQWRQPVSFIGKRQRLLDGQASVDVQLLDSNSKVNAGIAIHKDEHRFARIFYDTTNRKVVSEVLNTAKDIKRSNSQAWNASDRSSLKISYTEAGYKFWFSSGSDWSLLESVDTAELSGPDFVGPVVGVFVVGEEQGSPAEFVDFKAD